MVNTVSITFNNVNCEILTALVGRLDLLAKKASSVDVTFTGKGTIVRLQKAQAEAKPAYLSELNCIDDYGKSPNFSGVINVRGENEHTIDIVKDLYAVISGKLGETKTE